MEYSRELSILTFVRKFVAPRIVVPLLDVTNYW